MRKVIVWFCSISVAFLVGCFDSSRHVGSEHLWFKEGVLLFSEDLKTYIIVPYSEQGVWVDWGGKESGSMELDSGNIVPLKKGTIYVLSPDRSTVVKEIPATTRNLILCAYRMGRDEMDKIGNPKDCDDGCDNGKIDK